MFQLFHVAPFKLSSGSFSRHYCVLKMPSFFFSKGDDTLQTGFTCLYSFDYECQCAGEKD